MNLLEKSYYSTLVRETSALLAMNPSMALESSDVFGISVPGESEPFFIQVNGGGSEPFELMAYRGARGLELLWELNNCENEVYTQDLAVEVPALFATCVFPNDMDEIDREVLENAEGDFQEYGFPVYRSCRPGYQPAHLSGNEIHTLMQIVHQTGEVIRQLNEGRISLEVEDGKEDSYFLRKGVISDDDRLEWSNTTISMNLDDVLPKVFPKLKLQEVEILKGLPASERALRLDLVVSPFVPSGEVESPTTFLFTVTDYGTGEILASRVEEPGKKLRAFRESLLGTVCEVLMKIGSRPQSIYVELYSLCDMLADLIEKCGIELIHGELPEWRSSERDAIMNHLSTRFVQQPGKIIF